MHQKKKDHTPLILKIRRWWFPKVERISPALAARIFLRLFFRPLRYATPPKEQAVEKLAEKFSVVVSGRRIQFFSWGEQRAPYVLLVHGWAGRATQFRKFIRPLMEAGYRVIGFDGPAHGQSEGKTTNILEFEEVLNHCATHFGAPEAIIAHSFGGGASLYSIANGLPVKKQINIASPVVADEIIKTFLQAVRGSWQTGMRFKQLLKEKLNRNFEDYTIQSVALRLPLDVDVLVIHDEDDRDVLMLHPEVFKKLRPQIQTLYTKGLGHNRILKDDAVIGQCVAFIRSSRVTKP